MKVTVWTDGSCSPNPGRGAWCAIVEVGPEEHLVYGTECPTTNNRMEMMAALNGVKKAVFLGATEIEIITDSSYLANGMRKRLHRLPVGVTSHGPPNSDLWAYLVDACLDRRVAWTWVKGHATTVGNNRADEICRQLLREDKPPKKDGP